MNKTLIALATAAGLSVFLGSASADPGGYSPPHPGPGGGSSFSLGGPDTLLGAGAATGRAPDRYGWNPIFKRAFRLGSGGSAGPQGGNPLNYPGNWAAGGYGQNGPAYNPGGFPPQGGGCGQPGGCGPQGPGGPAQGTLVFPNHSFVRSPRDYFMMDMNK